METALASARILVPPGAALDRTVLAERNATPLGGGVPSTSLAQARSGSARLHLVYAAAVLVLSPSEPTVKTAANQPPLIILVVEDEAIVRMVTADVLGEAGYNVIEAVNSTEALELLDARPDVSLMLTDVRMPGELDGYNLSRLVRMKYAAIGIIVISGDSPPGEGDRTDHLVAR